jgi:hypothetical protein
MKGHDVGPTHAPMSSLRTTIVEVPTKEGSMTPNIADIIRQLPHGG